MHVGHILLVEAESHEEALDKVRSTIQYSDNPTPDWSDWNEIGGRWSDFFGKGKDVIRYTENTKLVEEKLTEWLAARKANIDRYYEEVKTLDISNMVTMYDPEGERNFGENTMKIWYLRKLAELLNDDWSPDTHVYDLEVWSSNLKSFRERVAVAPEMQYLVMVDFHF